MERYYKTKIVVEVLSNEPITTPFDLDDLEELAFEVINGGWSGVAYVEKAEELTREECVEALEAQGSDPSFLIMYYSEEEDNA